MFHTHKILKLDKLLIASAVICVRRFLFRVLGNKRMKECNEIINFQQQKRSFTKIWQYEKENERNNEVDSMFSLE